MTTRSEESTLAAGGLDHGLLVFNLLPSRTLHASRIGTTVQAMLDRLQAMPQALDAWHRHWSADLLREHGLQDRPVAASNRPELALAMLPSSLLCALASRLGAVLCAPRLRATIAGDEVRAMTASVPADLLHFARFDAAALHPGLPDSRRWDLSRALAAIDPLGRGALMSALRPAGEAVTARVELKLPDSPVQEAPLASADALALALKLLPRS